MTLRKASKCIETCVCTLHQELSFPRKTFHFYRYESSFKMFLPIIKKGGSKVYLIGVKSWQQQNNESL